MAGEVQLFAKNSAGETCLLQLGSFEPIKMTISIADQNPFSPASAYSQTFRIPGQGSNVAFFEDVYSVNGSSFNAAVAAEAWLLSDGFLFSVGNLTLQSVIRNEKYSMIEYEVYFLGDTSDFASSVGDEYMNQINTSDLDHSLTYDNVRTSWDAVGGTASGLKDGNVLYPLCEWGYTYDEQTPPYPTLNTVSVGFPKGSTGAYGQSFIGTGSTGALLLEQLKPATRIKWIWDKIFEDAGFTYESEFLNSDLFDNIYMISDSIERSVQQIRAGLCEVGSRLQRPKPGQTIKFPFSQVFKDLDNVFRADISTWVCPVTAGFLETYDFTIKGNAQFFRGSGVPSGAFRFSLKVNGSVVATKPIRTTDPPSGQYPNGGVDIFEFFIVSNLVQGDEVTIELEVLSYSNPELYFYNTQFACTSAPSQVIVSSFFPSEGSLRKIDFIKGITKAFNLVWEPSRDSQKSFIIEPWVDWVQGGQNQDWTSYLDGSMDFVQIPTFLNRPRILKFTGDEDEDVQNEIFQQQYKQPWLYRQYNSNINIITGEEEIKIPFAGIPLQSMPVRPGTPGGPLNPEWPVPTLAKLQPGNPGQPNSGKLEPIRPKPRLVFYNGKIPVPDGRAWYLFNSVVPELAVGISQIEYPLVSEYFTGNVVNFPDNNPNYSLALNFQSKPRPWRFSVYATESAGFPLPENPLTEQDLYTTFWDEFVDWNYDPYNRKVTAYFRLDPKQIQQLKFNDKIWVKDSWYLVEKIYDYPVGDIASVKVDLIKCPTLALPLITTSATGPIPGGEICSSVSLCYTANILDPETTYTYVDCFESLQSVTLSPNTCVSVCMLYPPVNALPSGWTAIPNGGCSGGTEYFEEGQDIELRMSATGASFGNNTRVTLLGSTGAGFVPLQYYNWDGTQFLTLTYNVPDNYDAQVRLEWATGFPGQPLVSEEVSLYVNGSQVATASASGIYTPLLVGFPSPITPGFVYGATAQIVY